MMKRKGDRTTFPTCFRVSRMRRCPLSAQAVLTSLWSRLACYPRSSSPQFPRFSIYLIPGLETALIGRDALSRYPHWPGVRSPLYRQSKRQSVGLSFALVENRGIPQRRFAPLPPCACPFGRLGPSHCESHHRCLSRSFDALLGSIPL